MDLPRNGGVTRVTLAAVLVAATLSLASAHGPAEWIQRGGYRNAAGELCCGDRDCFEISGERRIHHRGRLFRAEHSRDGAVQRGAALARRSLLALPMGRHAQVLLRTAAEHLTGLFNPP